jgi:hypothetical protein
MDTVTPQSNHSPQLNGSNSQNAPKQSPVLKWTLILAIAIILNLFWTYATRIVYNQPEYEDFCPQSQVVDSIETQEACLEVGGQWNANIGMKEPVVLTPDSTVKPTGYAQGYCDQTFTCNKNFQDASEVYNRNFFVIFVIVGVASLILSVFLVGSEAVSLGLSFGGVLSLIIGSVSYWSDMNDMLRVGILGVALASLIYLAYKKFQ